eukprot:1006-Eustigmatos_ZCMA.PRE.1
MALKTISLDRAEGPCLKNGGGVRSSVPSGMAARRGVPRPLFAGEDRAQALHALQGHAATAHHA